MTQKIPRRRLFISSPGDVREERFLAVRVIERLKAEFAGRLDLESVVWEYLPMRATETFQEQIPLASECDIAVFLLWSRLGTPLPSDKFVRPDGTPYQSGTEFEFEVAYEGHRARGLPDILLYRKSARPVVELDLDEDELRTRREQRQAVQRFIDRWFLQGQEGTLKAAFTDFESAADFEDRFEHHLRELLRTLVPEEAVEPQAATAIRWRQGSPFRGLNVFDYDHGPVFCGRTRETHEVLGRLRRQAASGQAFLAILGMSGSGKSSLARAGLAPMLCEGGLIDGVTRFRRSILKPGDGAREGGLFLALARALLLDEGAEHPRDANAADAVELGELLEENPLAALERLRRLVPELDQGERHFLLLDQLEELFTIEEVSPAAARFVDTLAVLASGRGKDGPLVWVAATLRSDFFPRLAEIPRLAELADEEGQFHLLPPDAGGFGRMIRQPAAMAGLHFEESPEHGSLDDRLLDGAIGQPGTLPLLEFALDELYARRNEAGVLTHAAYEAMGGVEGAVGRRAEEVYESMAASTREAFGPTMRALVTLGSDETATGRRARRSAFVRREELAFIDTMIGERLFLADDKTVGLAHEAILTHWPKLSQWIAENRDFLRARARVAQAESLWRQQERDEGYFLREGAPLAEAEDLLARWPEGVDEGLRAYIRASSEAAWAARERERRRTRRVLAAISTALVVALIGGAVAFMMFRRAEEQRIAADTARKDAVIAQEQAEAANAIAEVQKEAALASADTAQDLVLYMLTDLGELLDLQVERDLSIADSIVERVVQQYSGQETQSLPEELQLRAATHQTEVAMILATLGFTNLAAILNGEALETRQRLLEPEHPLTAGNSLVRAYAAATDGDPKAVMDNLVEARRLIRDHPQVDPLNYARSMMAWGFVMDHDPNEEYTTEAKIEFLYGLEKFVTEQVDDGDQKEALLRDFYGTFAGTLASAGQYEAAERYYLKATEKDFFQPSIAIAEFYLDQGRYQEASEYAEGALDRVLSQARPGAPGFYGALVDIGAIARTLGQFEVVDEAMEQIQKAKEVAPPSDHDLPKIYMFEAKHYMERLEIERAFSILAEAADAWERNSERRRRVTAPDPSEEEGASSWSRDLAGRARALTEAMTEEPDSMPRDQFLDLAATLADDPSPNSVDLLVKSRRYKEALAMAEGLSLDPSLPFSDRYERSAALALAKTHTGKAEEAVEILEALQGHFDQVPSAYRPVSYYDYLTQRIEVALLTGDEETARELADVVLEETGERFGTMQAARIAPVAQAIELFRIMGAEHPGLKAELAALEQAVAEGLVPPELYPEPYYERVLDEARGGQCEDLARRFDNIAKTVPEGTSFLRTSRLNYVLAQAFYACGLRKECLASLNTRIDDLNAVGGQHMPFPFLETALLAAKASNDRHDYTETKKFASTMYDMAVSMLGDEDPMTYEVACVAIDAYLDSGGAMRLEYPAKNLERAIALYGEGSPQHARSLMDLAIARVRLGHEPAETHPLLEQAHALAVELPLTAPEIIELDLYRAVLALGRDELDTAAQLVSAAVDAASALPEQAPLAHAIQDVGVIYRDKELYEAADPLLRLAFQIFEQEWGADTSEAALSASDLALSYFSQKRYQEAVSDYSRSASMYAQANGPDHPNTLIVLNGLGNTYYNMKAYPEALAVFEGIWKASERTNGPQDPTTIQSLAEVAHVRRSLGHYKKAEQLHAQALEAAEAAFGAQDARLLPRLASLGISRVDVGAYESAVECFRRSLALAEATSPDDPLQIALQKNNLAWSLAFTTNGEEAVEMAERALAVYTASEDTDAGTIADVRVKLARGLLVRNQEGDAPRALQNTERALPIMTEEFGPDHWRTARAIQTMAVALLKESRATEAAAAAAKAAEILRPIGHPYLRELAEAEQTLAEALRATGEEEKATAAEQRASQLQEIILAGPDAAPPAE